MRTMPDWCEDLSERSLEEVMATEAQNRVWSKELRQGTAALVASRLAKDISLVEYKTRRELVREEAAECTRRAMLLVTEINRRA